MSLERPEFGPMENPEKDQIEDIEVDFDESEPESEAPPASGRKRRFMMKFLILIVLLLGFGIGGGVYVLWQGAQFDDLEVLEAYKPVVYSRIYDRKGNLIDIISSEQRIILDYEDIPKDFVHALVAVEDEYFFNHIGVSPFGILSAVKDNLFSDRPRGASTLTQQLVKNITRDKRFSYKRKLKEQFLAVQLERRFTKEEIFSLYVNEVPFGNNQFGLAAAASYYFGKSPGALSLEECATLAGIPQAPSRFNPFRNPQFVINKRNIVLDRMAVENYITQEDCEAAKKKPLELRDRKRSAATRPVAAHFVDKVRNYLFDKYGEETVRTSGWDIHTTLDMDYQVLAEDSVREGLKGVDKALGYRHYDAPSIFSKEETDPGLINTYFDPTWHLPLQEGASIRGLVTEVQETSITVRIKEHTFVLTHDNMKWVARKIKDMNKYFKPGDVPLFKVLLKDDAEGETNLEAFAREDDEGIAEENVEETGEEIGEEEVAEVVVTMPYKLELDQEPDIQGAFMAVDIKTGDIMAMVGGYDYNKSKFNRAEMAKRQVGSAFKPIVVGAALERGFTLTDTLFDEPTLFVDPNQFYFDDRGELQVRYANAAQERRMRLGLLPTPKPYQPHNYYNKYVGRVTLQEALAQSKNIVSVKLLNSVGYDRVLEYANRLRVPMESLPPFPSLALGAMEMTLSDVVYAYGTFSNAGVRYEPRFVSIIMDSKGRVIEENHPKGEQVISPQNAYLVKDAMRAVVFSNKGSARRLKNLKYPHLAGKTGTTNDYADAWFIGYSPNMVLGAWVGRDLKHTIGKGRAGSNTALPICHSFLEGVRDDLPKQGWRLPEGLSKHWVDKDTGRKITQDCDCPEDEAIAVTFIRGTEPTEICTKAEKRQFTLPWYLQKRTYQYDEQEGGIKPNTVMIDYASQLRANDFLETLRLDEDIN